MPRTKKTVKNKKDATKETSKRKQLSGVVDSKKMEKTIVVKVTSSYAHPIYDKILKKTKKYKVHSEKDVKVGDKVVIEQTRPISKEKCWKVVDVKK